MATKFTHTFAKEYLSEYDYVLLDIYKNARTPMKYLCNNGHECIGNFDNFRRGKRCKICVCTSHRLDNLYVNNYLKSYGYISSDIYKNHRTKMNYICPNGHAGRITFNSFQQGNRCKQCYLENNTGENNFRWIKDREKVKSLRSLHSRSATYKLKYRKFHNIMDMNLHIDHIIPVKAFHDHNVYDLEIINNFDNFQVLTAKENRSKWHNYTEIDYQNYMKSHNYE